MENCRKRVCLQWKKTKSRIQTKNRDWSELPGVAVDEIIDRLNLYDYISFAAVCVSWRFTAMDHRNHRGKLIKKKPWDNDHQIPLLMLPFDGCGLENPAKLYSVTKNSSVLDLQVPNYDTRLIGSSFGWIISLDEDLPVRLSNPFAPCLGSICIPPVLNQKLMKEDNCIFFGSESVDLFGKDSFDLYHSCCNYYISKAILSDDPGSDYVVMVIYGWLKRLAFIRPSANAARWIYLDRNLRGFSDVIYSKSTGSFHAVSGKSGKIYTIKIQGEEKCDCFVSAPSLESEGLRYIVETCEGDFLQVIRKMEIRGQDLSQVVEEYDTTWSTNEFEVHILQKRGSISEWVEVKDLGDNALFLDDSASISVAPSRYPNTLLRAGSIYFLLPYQTHLVLFERQIYTDDMGVVNIRQQQIQGQPAGQPFRINEFDISAIAMSYRPPIWVLPTFQGTQPCKRIYDTPVLREIEMKPYHQN